MKNGRQLGRLPKVLREVQEAMTEAVADVIEQHRQSGHPLVIWRNGRVVHVPADELAVRSQASARRARKAKRS